MACQLGLDRIVLSNARKLPRDYFGLSLLRKPETLRGLLVEELTISSDVSLPDTKGGNFFSHHFWFPDLFLNSCSMWNISLIKIKKIRWTDPISLPCRGRPAVLPPIAPSSPIAATAVHRDLYAAHRDCAAVPAR
jgi:hypothetical protein